MLATARGVYAHFGAVILDLLWMQGRPAEELLRARRTSRASSTCERRCAAGRGVVCATGHLGNWEVQAVGLGCRWSAPSAVVARPLDNPALDAPARTRSAPRRGNTVIYKQTALAAGDPAHPAASGGRRDPDRPERPGEGRHLRATSSAGPALHHDRGRGARAQDRLRRSCPAHCAAAAERALPHGLRPAGRVDAHGDREAEDIARLTQELTSIDRGLGAGDARAVALAAPSLEDAAPSRARRRGRPAAARRDQDAVDRPSASSSGRRTGSATSCCRCRRCATCGGSFPAARLEVLARPWVADLYGAVPEVDAVVESRGVAADAAAAARALRLGLLLPNSFGDAPSRCGARGVPERWGYATDGARAAPDARAAACRAGVRGRSQVYYYRAMLEGLGSHVSAPPDASLALPRRSGRARAARCSARTGPGSASTPAPFYGTAKRWLPERFAAAATLVAGARGARVAIVGGGRGAAARRGDRGAARRAPARVLCGETTLAELVGVLARLRLLLTNDSGPMHLAAALGTPLVAVFGSTDWTRDGARLGARARSCASDVECAPCLLRECPIDHRCMTRVARGPRAPTRRAGAARGMSAEARHLHGPRRHAVPRGGLRQPPSPLPALPVDGGRGARDQPRGLARGRGDEPGGRRARLLPGVGDPRGAAPAARRRWRRAARASTRSTRARTTRRSGEPPYRQRLRLPQAAARACCAAPRRSSGADLARSWVVGDRYGDLQLAWNVGRAGRAREERLRPRRAAPTSRRGWSRQPDLVAENLLEAVERILGREARVSATRPGCEALVRRAFAAGACWCSPTSWPTSSSTAASSASAARRRC